MGLRTYISTKKMGLKTYIQMRNQRMMGTNRLIPTVMGKKEGEEGGTLGEGRNPLTLSNFQPTPHNPMKTNMLEWARRLCKKPKTLIFNDLHLCNFAKSVTY